MFPTDFSEITKIISNLKTKTSQGDDNISTKLLKLTSNITSNAIAHITNLSINQGIVPDKLKIAKVIPIFKKNERHEAGNYRPISLLSIINKIMEKVVYSRLYKFLTKFKLFYKYQFGFRKKHSTIHALIEIVENIIMDLENKKHIAGLYLDLSKAFDTVNHDIYNRLGCLWQPRTRREERELWIIQSKPKKRRREETKQAWKLLCKFFKNTEDLNLGCVTAQNLREHWRNFRLHHERWTGSKQ